MQWIKFTLTTRTEAVDFISAVFDEIGIEGIEIEDNVPLTEEETKGMFIDILPVLPKDEGVAKVHFYLEPTDNIEDILAKVEAALDEVALFTDLGERSLQREMTADVDWINNWKAFFKPFYIGNILIKPSWEEIPSGSSYETLIQIDPGTAFGTGAHESTKLCIMQLEKYIKPLKAAGQKIRVLDVGTGSGILGIAALKLGAASVFATELDESAFPAIADNLRNNAIPDSAFVLQQGNIIEDRALMDKAGYACYDICLSNILAPVIIRLQECLGKHMKKGAVWISSGIIDSKEEEVLAAFWNNPDFTVLECSRLGEWCSITVRRV